MSTSSSSKARRFPFSFAAFSLALLVLTWTDPVSGQLAVMSRSPEHSRLDFLLGEWTHSDTQTLLGKETVVSSRSRYAWLPGGVWLRGEATIWGLPGIEEHKGWAHLTFDAASGEYVQLWLDNQSAILFDSLGRWTDEDTLVFEGSHEWGGRTIHQRVIYTVISPDNYTREFLSSSDGSTWERRSLANHVRVAPG